MAPKLHRLHLKALVEHTPSVNEEVLFSQHVAPHFSAILADTTHLAIVTFGETMKCEGIHFHVAGLDPEKEKIGIVDGNTEIFATADEVGEYRRIHVVPFSDTLPSAYNYDLFQDHVRPYIMSHLADRLVEGQTFSQAGVQFKVVAVDPAGPCRIGSSTDIYSEGRLHPTAASLLSPEDAMRLSMFPPGLQVLLLQTDMFGNGDIADRIMAAEGIHNRAHRGGLSGQNIAGLTQPEIWSEDLVSRSNLDQLQCRICLQDFVCGEEVRRLPCQHVFHVLCVDEWLGRDAHCPLCRHGLQPPGHGRQS